MNTKVTENLKNKIHKNNMHKNKKNKKMELPVSLNQCVLNVIEFFFF